MSAAFNLWLLAAMAVLLVGSASLHGHVDAPVAGWLLLGLALYTLGNLVMGRLIRESGMAIAVTLSAAVQLLMANFGALAVFGERPQTLQLAGIGLGVDAVALNVLPGAGR